MVLIKGDYGSGKTSLILHTFENLSKSYKTLYFTQKTIKNRYKSIKPSFIEIFIKKKRIIAIDDVEELDKEVTDWIREKYDSGFLHSVIFSGINPKLPDDLISRIGHRVIELKGINLEEAKLILKSRIGDYLRFIDDEAVKIIYDNSNKNPRRFLILCEISFIYAYEQNKRYITKDLVIEAIDSFRKTNQSFDEEISKEVEAVRKLGSIYESLGDREKMIVDILRSGEKGLDELSEATGIPKNILSKYLSKLLSKDLVKKRRKGQRVYYSLKL